jgi:hypothetical protein
MEAEKQYVRSDETGELVEVVPVHATATVSAVSNLQDKAGGGLPELPPGSAKMIEQAMVYAIQRCNEQGIFDAKRIREAMMQAREDMKSSLRARQIELQSQQQAAAQEK